MDLLSAAPPFLRIPVPHVVIRKTRVIDIRYNDISRCLRSFFSLLLWRGTATVEAIERKKEGQKKSNRVSHSPNFLVVVTPSKRQMSRWTARNPPPHLGGQSSSPPPMVVSIDVTPRPRQPATSYTAVRRTGGVATALDVGAGGGNRTTAILATIHHGNSERSGLPSYVTAALLLLLPPRHDRHSQPPVGLPVLPRSSSQQPQPQPQPLVMMLCPKAETKGILSQLALATFGARWDSARTMSVVAASSQPLPRATARSRDFSNVFSRPVTT